MSKVITATSGAPEIDDGTYPARVLTVEEVEGKFGAQYQLDYEIIGLEREDGSPVTLHGWCSQKLSPKSKLREWATAILGTTIATGQTIDVDDFIGKTCRVQIVNVDAEGEDRPKIEHVLRARTAGKGMKAIADTCACGEPVSTYTSEGVALCEAHGEEGAA